MNVKGSVSEPFVEPAEIEGEPMIGFDMVRRVVQPVLA